MKKKISAVICGALLLTLWGCGAKPESAPEPAAAQTEAVTMPTQPAPTEPEEIKELVMTESFNFRIQEGDKFYTRYIIFNPYSRFYETYSGLIDDRFFGMYSLDDEGRLVMEIEGKPCVFSRTENGLRLESGNFSASSDFGSVEMTAGTESTSHNESILRAGIHVLDTSEYDVAFDEVIMNLDLTEMTFTLKCFDGSVISGTLGFEEDKLVCSHEGGAMWFYLFSNANGYHLTSTKSNYEKGSIVLDQLMICPQTDSSLLYRFLYADNQEQEIIADPDIVPLDSYKHEYTKYYSFLGEIDDQGERIGCGFEIYYYPIQDKWEFHASSRGIEVDCTENPDGTITFSHNGKHWNFHREGDDLYFDGGDTLIADNGVEPKESYYRKMDVPVGAAIYLRNTDYVYDALYILPGSTLEECYAAIQLDTKNQLIKIQCWDGKVLQGSFTYGDEYSNDIVFECEIPDYVGTRTAHITLRPSGHALGVSNQWMLNIGPGDLYSKPFYFFPVQGVEYEDMTIE